MSVPKYDLLVLWHAFRNGKQLPDLIAALQEAFLVQAIAGYQDKRFVLSREVAVTEDPTDVDLRKRGVILPVTMECAYFDRLQFLLGRAVMAGELFGSNKENRLKKLKEENPSTTLRYRLLVPLQVTPVSITDNDRSWDVVLKFKVCEIGVAECDRAETWQDRASML